MKGFVIVEPEALTDDAELARWVERGADARLGYAAEVAAQVGRHARPARRGCRARRPSPRSSPASAARPRSRSRPRPPRARSRARRRRRTGCCAQSNMPWIWPPASHVHRTEAAPTQRKRSAGGGPRYRELQVGVHPRRRRGGTRRPSPTIASSKRVDVGHRRRRVHAHAQERQVDHAQHGHAVLEQPEHDPAQRRAGRVVDRAVERVGDPDARRVCSVGAAALLAVEADLGRRTPPATRLIAASEAEVDLGQEVLGRLADARQRLVAALAQDATASSTAACAAASSLGSHRSVLRSHGSSAGRARLGDLDRADVARRARAAPAWRCRARAASGRGHRGRRLPRSARRAQHRRERDAAPMYHGVRSAARARLDRRGAALRTSSGPAQHLDAGARRSSAISARTAS